MNKEIEKDLTVMEIMTYGCPVLKQKAQPVQNITEEIIRLAENMVFTMRSAPGIGLAAPQVNRSTQLITIDLAVGEKDGQLIILLNPEILEYAGEAVMEEGCLSVPEINENVVRPERVLIKGVTLDGKDITLEASGLLARVFCHEIDHLKGKLFVEHLSPLKQRLIRQKFKKKRAEGSTR